MLDVETDGPIREIRLSRPERRNALTPGALSDLREAVRSAEEPVVYLHGAGKAFCAGADLDVVEELDREAGVAFARRGQRTARAIERSDAVVVAGVDGAARGGGVELALACDLVVATPNATFAETGVTLGLFGAWGGTVRLPETLSTADAADLALSGRVVDADEALRMGLVSRIVESPRSVAEELANNDHGALRAIKRRLRDRDDSHAQERREAAVFGDLIAARNDADEVGE